MKAYTPFNLGGVPPQLAALPIWLPWKAHRDGDRTRKVPVDFQTGRPVSHKDPNARLSFEEVLLHLHGLRATGIGVSLTVDIRPPLTVVDLDNCVDQQTGEISEAARGVMARLDSYTELSPSGTGLHIFVIGAKPTGACRKAGVEMYSDQFVTVTGHHVPGTPPDLKERQTAIQQLHGELLDAPLRKNQGSRSMRPAYHLNRSDEEVLAKMFGSRKGSVIRALWEGDTGPYNGDHSSADLALASHLAYWTNRHRVQVDRLFRQSALFRPKWDERRGSDGRTYGQITIDRACGDGGSDG